MNTISPRRGQCLRTIDVLVLAGGLGTRIRPVLGDVPKLLAPIAGRTYLDFLIDWLQSFGARRLIFGLGHRAQAITEYLLTHPRAELEIETLVEPRPMGTAGAIRFARDALRSDPVMVMNGDSFAEADLCALADRHRTAGALATILCAQVDDAARYGRVEIDGEGFVARFIEKDTGFSGAAFINAGVYLISAPLLDNIASGIATSIEHDVFARLPLRSLATYAECSKFIDIGTPEALARADEIFAKSAWSSRSQ